MISTQTLCLCKPTHTVIDIIILVRSAWDIYVTDKKIFINFCTKGSKLWDNIGFGVPCTAVELYTGKRVFILSVTEPRSRNENAGIQILKKELVEKVSV